MKRFLTIALFSILTLALVGCDDDDKVLIVDDPPVAPQGVYSVTGDEMVYVIFNGIYDRDVRAYYVYRSQDALEGYTYIGEVEAIDNPNLDLLIYTYVDAVDVDNGETYYYAVTSVDFADQESELSAENVFDTPRPEGINVLYSTSVQPALAGFDLGLGQYVDTNLADVYVDDFNDVMYLNAVGAQTDIQDLGYTSEFDEVGYAPLDGWSTNGFVEIIEGHTYIIWTTTNHFAKMRAAEVNPTGKWIRFEWAYQTDIGNPELSVPVEPGTISPSEQRVKSSDPR